MFLLPGFQLPDPRGWGFSMLSAEPEAWTRVSAYHTTLGPWTICAVRIRGELRYELWRDRSLIASDTDPANLRALVAQAGVQL